jgi:hypothetical protein
MRERVHLESRCTLLKQFASQYREASSARKRVLLDTFAKATGYYPDSGIWQLNHVRTCCTRLRPGCERYHKSGSWTH